MLNIIKSEHLKLKHTFGIKLPIIAPIIPLLLVLLLTGGLQNTLPAATWNWWYMTPLSGMLAVLCYLNIRKDGELKFHNILSSQISMKKIWLGKIIYCAIALLLSNFIILLGTLIGGFVFGTTISVWDGFCAAVLLSISYLWQIPLFMFLNTKFGMFASIFSSMALSVSGVVTLADSDIWWVYPSSIPIRLMCPVLGLLPNGLPIPAGSELFSASVIFPGILISLAWFIVLTIATIRWFSRLESK